MERTHEFSRNQMLQVMVERLQARGLSTFSIDKAELSFWNVRGYVVITHLYAPNADGSSNGWTYYLEGREHMVEGIASDIKLQTSGIENPVRRLLNCLRDLHANPSDPRAVREAGIVLKVLTGAEADDTSADEAEAATVASGLQHICHCTDGFHEPKRDCGDCGGTGFRKQQG